MNPFAQGKNKRNNYKAADHDSCNAGTTSDPTCEVLLGDRADRVGGVERHRGVVRLPQNLSQELHLVGYQLDPPGGEQITIAV